MSYPGHVVKVGETNQQLVRTIAGQLAKRGYASTSPAGVFDAKFKSLVKLFQAQTVDTFRRPLKVDGEVGPLTWSALFGATPVTIAPTGLAGAALSQAVSQIGVMEDPVGSNSGRIVKQYLASVGVAPGAFWCMAFVFWCFERGAQDRGVANLFPRTAGCLNAWNRVKSSAPARIITRAQAIANLGLVRPGLVFILDHGAGMGHTGFVRQSASGALRTVEGNTNNDGSNNGVGVFELNSRSVMNPHLKGFIDFN